MKHLCIGCAESRTFDIYLCVLSDRRVTNSGKEKSIAAIVFYAVKNTDNSIFSLSKCHVL